MEPLPKRRSKTSLDNEDVPLVSVMMHLDVCAFIMSFIAHIDRLHLVRSALTLIKGHPREVFIHLSRVRVRPSGMKIEPVNAVRHITVPGSSLESALQMYPAVEDLRVYADYQFDFTGLPYHALKILRVQDDEYDGDVSELCLRFPELEHVSIPCNTDEHLEYICSLSGLKELVLSGLIIDNNVNELNTLMVLEDLQLVKCSLVTQTGVCLKFSHLQAFTVSGCEALILDDFLHELTLKRLTKLKLEGVYNKDFPTILDVSKLSSLVELSLQHVVVHNLLRITSLRRLEILQLVGIRIERGLKVDLRQFPTLKRVCAISSGPTSWIAQLPNAVRHLSMSGNQLGTTSFEDVTSIESLHLLDVGETSAHVSPGRTMRGLRVFACPRSFNPADIVGFDKLQLLDISVQGAHVDLSTLGDLPVLKKLQVRIRRLDESIFQVDFLRNARRLEVLILKHLKIESIEPLRMLTQIVELDIAFTRVSDLSPISGLSKMKRLDIHETKVKDVSPLLGLTRLEFLRLPSRVNCVMVRDASPGLPLLIHEHLFEDTKGLQNRPCIEPEEWRAFQSPPRFWDIFCDDGD